MIEGYLLHNSQAIQTSKDPSILNMSNIKKWGEDVGASILKKNKKKSTKEDEKVK
jgi:hypothetical protein